MGRSGQAEIHERSNLPWERSSSAPCGEYNDAGLGPPWQAFTTSDDKLHINVNSASNYNRMSLENKEIKEEIIDDDVEVKLSESGCDSGYDNNKEEDKSNNKSSNSHNSSCTNESMSITNTTATISDGSRTNDRKLISPSQRASRNRFGSTPHESKCKVRQHSFHFFKLKLFRMNSILYINWTS